MGQCHQVASQLLQKALLIRRFEERLFQLFSEGKLNGTIHTCIGQEWIAVALAENLRAEDYVLGTHRAHGHFLARTDDVEGLMAELMGRATGVAGGIGGTQHLVGPHFLSSGVQGGLMPVAAGIALREKLRRSRAIVCIFIGDGTLGEGVVYETFNMAAIWSLPLLVVVEQNHYAQSTATAQTTAGTVLGRAEAFGIRYFSADTWDIPRLLATAKEVTDFVRETSQPAILEVDTYRLKPHSKGDDNRDPSEIRSYEQRDFLNAFLATQESWVTELVAAADRRIEHAVLAAANAPLCEYRGDRRSAPNPPLAWECRLFVKERVSDAIYRALREALERDPTLVLLGEDIEGPYGGAFKVTRDLSQLFPGRVRNTPISEAAIVGVGNGYAVAGGKAVVEIMFGDFLTLAFDQLQQHAAKFRQMYNQKAQMPVVVRTPMGGKRGYGPTHSQSIEKHFLGISDLCVLAINNRLSPYHVYQVLLSDVQSPHLVIENKILYTRHVSQEVACGFSLQFSNERFPTVKISPVEGGPQITILCYGGMLEEVEAAVQRAFDEWEILCEIICPTQLSPLSLGPILESVKRTGRLLTVEEGSDVAGFGAEALAALSECDCCPSKFRRLGYFGIIPSCMPRELELLPNASMILDQIISLTRE